MQLRKILGAFAILVFMVPVSAAAQVEDLRAAIQASILSDSRAQMIPPEQLKILVDSLVAQAQAQNLSAADILWRPQVAEAATVGAAQPMTSSSQTCASGWQGYLCQFNIAFGFEGGNYEVPLFLLITSGLLIAVLWELIAHHRKALVSQSAPETGAVGVPNKYI